ncbi:MAG TPA: tryptophan--tRNA ligase [Candidatus Nanoarchaeia archaeon]|nr:tryptophan--tRNA ligase [Candidatus Nanoarchaeia archaeon]
MTVLVDPWGSSLVEDYERLLTEFGLEQFSQSQFPDPNRIMRRGVVFSGKDLGLIAECIKKKKHFYALSGIMPSGDKLHLGNKLVVEQLRYFQEHGAETYILIADLESAATRGVSIEEARQRALEFHIPAYLALGLDPKKTIFYFQSENMNVIKIAYEVAQKITLNEFRATYGSAEPARIMSSMTQIGDMLYPQITKRMPGIIPIGIDQAPHLRLARDYIRRAKDKKYFLLSSIYHKFTPALNGDFKMSKSLPESCLSLPEDAESIKRKIQKAKTGGRKTLEEHRKLGGIPEEDMVFELLKQHFVEDDAELMQIYKAYKSGKMTSGELKTLAIEKIASFMADFEKKLEKARKQVKTLQFI